MIRRQKTITDFESITDVTIGAFRNHPISQQTEHFIINALRQAGVLILSLVAEINGQVVGHIAFSPIEISEDINLDSVVKMGIEPTS
ncbi:MAG: hypothetical protein HOC09_10940 [Deltaproteobacteria bacterium]|jgi:putative acetyltransferase|nr:hypothetical protein [Deltaproteobacteria bacterium]